jgi:DNA-directed RNA polymerase subunit RPC12/RpoP
MKEGIEKSGLRWTIDELAGDDIPIKIYDKDGKLLVEYMHKCMHRPIFGLDVDDVEQINKVLDRLLKECEEKDAAEDAISRKEVNKLVDELARSISDERCFMSRGRDTSTIMQDILDLPSVRPRPKIGKTGSWIIINRDGVNKYVCSECNNEPLLIGESYPVFKLSDYCPYCGAKMEVKE